MQSAIFFQHFIFCQENVFLQIGFQTVILMIVLQFLTQAIQMSFLLLNISRSSMNTVSAFNRMLTGFFFLIIMTLIASVISLSTVMNIRLFLMLFQLIQHI